MKKAKIAEERIVRLLKEFEAGATRSGHLPQTRHWRDDLLRVEVEMRWYGGGSSRNCGTRRTLKPCCRTRIIRKVRKRYRRDPQVAGKYC